MVEGGLTLVYAAQYPIRIWQYAEVKEDEVEATNIEHRLLMKPFSAVRVGYRYIAFVDSGL